MPSTSTTAQSATDVASIRIPLLLTRVGFGLFLFAWGLNKLVNPGSTGGILAKYYGVDGLGNTPGIAFGLFQMIVSAMILVALFKTVTYLIGLLMHGASIAVTIGDLILPLAEGSNLLFMSGLPVFTAILGLFLARRHDTMLSLDAMRQSRASRPVAGATGQA